MKKKNTIKTNDFIRTAQFCVECGKELENYSLNESESNEQARERFHNCCKTGKFNGEICSRIFIKEYDERNIIEEEIKNINFPEDAEN